MEKKTIIAVDLGAESCRVIAGILDPDRGFLETRLISQFQTGILPIRRSLRWNVYRLYEEILKGLKECGRLFASKIESVGFDTWGVDFGLLAADGSLIELPYSYRDERTIGLSEEFGRILPRRTVYELTGIQIMDINSLYQLYAMAKSGSSALKSADALLFLPDLFNYLLSGQKKNEYTIATTSQMLNGRSRQWDPDIFKALGLSRDLMRDIVAPGTLLGGLTPEVRDETGLTSCAVTAVGCHDTASAIAAVPAEGDDWAYISSGTWSLLGIESAAPVITDESYADNIANEGGVGGTYRILKNVAGLWILQRYRASRSETAEMDYETLVQKAADKPDFRFLIDPDDPRFFNPKNMADAIRSFCRETKQPAPESTADFVTLILVSLAFKYRMVLDRLKRISGRPIRRIHIIGGGARNRALNRFTANATGLPVFAGPFEATATGNILVQAMGLGYFDSLDRIRQVVRNSSEVVRAMPQDVSLWAEGYDRFRQLLNQREDS
ncbi:MAG: rhamnulokinase [Candidatus Aminicenantales bacterium]